MKIVVCVKQVPGTNNVEVDPVTGTLRRDGVESKMNPYDSYALELGLQLRDQYGGSVHVVSMGPNQAKAVLLEAVYMGADGGILLSDRKFAGADVLATSYTLVGGLKTLDFLFKKSSVQNHFLTSFLFLGKTQTDYLNYLLCTAWPGEL